MSRGDIVSGGRREDKEGKNLRSEGPNLGPCTLAFVLLLPSSYLSHRVITVHQKWTAWSSSVGHSPGPTFLFYLSYFQWISGAIVIRIVKTFLLSFFFSPLSIPLYPHPSLKHSSCGAYSPFKSINSLWVFSELIWPI